MTDDEIIAEALRGDVRAERQLYDVPVDRVYRLAYRMAGDETLARDFTQDTFIRAFERLADFRGESSLATWLHSIAVSVILNGLKKVRRIRGREIGGDTLPEVSITTREAEPDLKVRLRRAIGGLPDCYRTVFLLHDDGRFEAFLQRAAAEYNPPPAEVPRDEMWDVVARARAARRAAGGAGSARKEPDRELRRQAIFWLGQSKDPRAISYFEEVLTRGR